MKAEIINKKVVEIAKQIEDAKNDPNIMGVVFSRKRQYGLKKAVELSQSKNIDYDILSEPPDKNNDLGGGWSNGYKDFKQLWQETKDAECEIIEQKRIGNTI